jgi:cytochrome c
VHDISFDPDHQLVTDRQGRIWFSDILNNALGWIDPRSGKTGAFKIPPVPGRVGNEQVYGLAMSPDRKHVWYCQLGIASFGSFNVETSKFETHVEFDSPLAGPRRMSMSDDGILYLGLYGAGQLAAYDTNAQRMVGIYDLPDRASAPYTTTWDPVRRVVWIPTSNADVIYRFDPKDRSIGVLPMPRERAFLRMLHVDRRTGLLVTAYANIVEHVRGPRMVLVIDPGDRPVAAPASPAAASTPTLARTSGPVTPLVSTMAPPSDLPPLLARHHCDECHARSDVRIGPPWVAISSRYSGEGDAPVDHLAHKIIAGGGGNWGTLPMVPNERLSLADAREMARSILSIRPR